MREPINTLAIDTSCHCCSVAIERRDGYIQHQHMLSPRQHEEKIFPMITQILSETSLTIDNIDLLAFCNGPGSFIGLRLSATIIQSFAYAHQIPVVGVSSLAILAQNAEEGSHVLTAMNAFQQEVYFGHYIIRNQLSIPIVEDHIIHPEKIQAHVTPSDTVVRVGDGWTTYQSKIPVHLQQYPIHTNDPYPLAKNILYLAKHKYTTGEYGDAFSAIPVYVREQVVKK